MQKKANFTKFFQKLPVKGLIFLENYIKMEYGENRKFSLHAQNGLDAGFFAEESQYLSH